VFSSLACIVVAVGLYAVVNRTRLGMMIRAGASNRDMVRGLGVDIRLLYRIVFAGGVALAALAGMIAAPLSSVYPGMGSSVLIICFVVVVIGGIGSITGALIASLLVGIVYTFGKVFFAEWSGFGVGVHPDGDRPDLAAPGCGRVATEAPLTGDGLAAEVGSLPDIARREPGGWWVPAAVVVLLAALPALISPYAQDLVVRIAIYAIFALSLELLVGAVGLVSLGHAAFLGIGAYAVVLGSGDAGAPLPWVLALAVGGAAAYALFVGALSLRTRGVYFIMVTLAFAQMAYFVVHDTKAGGGSDGIFLNV
jgi:ABC-type branched-subunit amino acid transport system permease subunit